MSYKPAGNYKRYASDNTPYYRLVVEVLLELFPVYAEIDQEQLAALVGGRQLGIYTTSSKPGQSLRRAMDNAEANGLVTKTRKHDPQSGGLRVVYQLHLNMGQLPLAPGEWPL